ncbi:phage tail protein I [Paenibacillus crassostreae]|uniref:Phage tail protein n=1 Tax=Paenibacillus crassostreae TaxID=1763538 RepID=A0A167C5L9_9BACL|nr:phage tail protein I [Paenibacillus crassostreae]AOZ91620.1 phage tail protein I [Paenibacillus crassostreae]OAB72806.1 phage tail protein [Paenibacillus crassostreae]
MDLQTLDLLKLQTKYMRDDETVIGLSAALGGQFKRIASEIVKVMIYSQTDQLPEEALDVLAWQFGADWYDANASIETKREAIDNVLYLAQIRGTPAAVQRIVEIYFGDGRVEEWFEYGGEPGYFRVITNNPEATNEKATQFIKSVNSVKRKSAWLEVVILEESTPLNLYIGGAVHVGEYILVG